MLEKFLVMRNMRNMKNLAFACLFLFGSVGVVSAQNQVINGTLTVQQDAYFNTSSGNTTINGNTTLGGSNTNTITFNGVAATNLDMGNKLLLNLQSLSVGAPAGGQYTPVTGAITLYNSANTGTSTIIAANNTSSNYTYVIPNTGANGTFVMTSGAQTLTGQKTFTNSPLANTAPLVVNNTHASGSGNNALGATITSTGTSTGGTNTALTLTASNGTTNTALAVTSGNVNIAGLTASKPVFTDANKNLTNTGTIPTGDLPIATSTSVGVVSVDNTTITITAGAKLPPSERPRPELQAAILQICIPILRSRRTNRPARTSRLR